MSVGELGADDTRTDPLRNEDRRLHLAGGGANLHPVTVLNAPGDRILRMDPDRILGPDLPEPGVADRPVVGEVARLPVGEGERQVVADLLAGVVDGVVVQRGAIVELAGVGGLRAGRHLIVQIDLAGIAHRHPLAFVGGLGGGEATAAVQDVDHLRPLLRLDRRLPDRLVEAGAQGRLPGLDEDCHLLIGSVGDRGPIISDVHGHLQVEVGGAVHGRLAGEGVVAHAGQTQLLRDIDHGILHRPGAVHDLDRRLEQVGLLQVLVRVDRLQAKPLQVGGVRQDIVRVLRRTAYHHIEGDNQRQLGFILLHLRLHAPAHHRLDQRDPVDEESTQAVRIALIGRGDQLVDRVAAQDGPAPLGRVAVTGEETALLVDLLLPSDRDPPWGPAFGGALQVVPAAHLLVPDRRRVLAALPVVVADQVVEDADGIDRVEAVGVHGRSPVGDGHCPLAVRGELPGHLDDRLLRNAAELGVLGDRLLHGPFLQEGESRLDPDSVDLGIDFQVAIHRGRCRHGYPAGEDDEALGIPQLQGVGPELLASRIGEVDQVRGVGPGGLTVGLGSGTVRIAQVALIVPLVLNDPADHAHGEGQVLTRLDRHPEMRLLRGLREPGIDHDQLHAPRNGVGQLGRQPGRPLVGGHEVGAPGDQVLGVIQVGVLPLLQRIAITAAHVGQDAGHAADPAVVEDIQGAKGLVGHADHEVLTVTVGEGDLVRLRPQVRMLRIDQQVLVLGVESGLGHLPFLHLLPVGHDRPLGHVGEVGLHPGGDLIDRLLPRDGLPLARATGTDPLQRLGDPVGIVGGLDTGLPLQAGASALEPPAVDGEVAMPLGRIHDTCRIRDLAVRDGVQGGVRVAGNLANVGLAAGLRRVGQGHLDRAMGLALLTGGVDHPFGRGLLPKSAGAVIRPGSEGIIERLGEPVAQEGHGGDRATDHGGAGHKLTAGDAVLRTLIGSVLRLVMLRGHQASLHSVRSSQAAGSRRRC